MENKNQQKQFQVIGLHLAWIHTHPLGVLPGLDPEHDTHLENTNVMSGLSKYTKPTWALIPLFVTTFYLHLIFIILF